MDESSKDNVDVFSERLDPSALKVCNLNQFYFCLVAISTL